MSDNARLDELEEDDDEEVYSWRGREAFIFLIDAFLSEDREMFSDCLQKLRDSIMSGLLSRKKDLVGIVFCNTLNSPEPKDTTGMEHIVVHKNTAVILPLNELSKSSVEYFLNFVDLIQCSPEFEETYGHTEGNFSDAIWLCTNLFNHSDYKLQTPTIIYFTARDTPHEPTSREFQLAIQKATDLKDTDMDFTVVPMKDDFDYSTFYKEFICTVRDEDLDSFQPRDPEEERNLVVKRMVRNDYKTRCNNHLRWVLGDGLELAVGLYNYYQRNIYPKNVRLERQTNKIVVRKHVQKLFAADPVTAEVISERYCMPEDQKKVIEIGGKSIGFTNDEISRLKCVMPPGLKLLGFKPLSSLSLTNFIRSSSFIYPDEKLIEGSTKIFRALWQKCIEKEKFAFCVLVQRRKIPPRYVALMPVEAGETDMQSIVRNDGFRVIYFPFEIDQRKVDLSDRKAPEVPNHGIELFSKVVKKLRMRYKPLNFRDPNFESLQANIIGQAFDIQPEEPGESMTPDIEVQDQRIEAFIDSITELFGRDLEVTKKRRNEENDEGQASKAPRITDDDLSTEQMQHIINNNTISQLTVKQLKSYLQKNNVKGIASGTKPTLIDKVLELHS